MCLEAGGEVVLIEEEPVTGCKGEVRPLGSWRGPRVEVRVAVEGTTAAELFSTSLKGTRFLREPF